MKPVVGMVTRRAQKDTPGLARPAGRPAQPGSAAGGLRQTSLAGDD